MTTPRLADAQGRPFPLGRLLTDGTGGEGAVYALPNDTARVAKVYLNRVLPLKPDQARKLKFQTTVKDADLLKHTGWPLELLFDGANCNQVVGFTMPMAAGRPVWNLYQPQERLKHFPQATWAFQVHTALNLAVAFENIHRLGHVVGDVSMKNVFASPQATVTVIDCDSFQVRTPQGAIPCEVGTPGFVPPELIGRRLDFERTPNHDRFGLAVLIYQLLFVGRHPYAGIYRGNDDPSPDDNVREFRFAQGPMAKTWHMSPPPLTPTFDDFTSDVGTLFRRAFERGSQNGTRPTPQEWIGTLGTLEKNIATCTADAGHKYWKDCEKGCVWCRLAENGGPEYYYGAGGTGGTFAVDEARLKDVLRRLDVAPPAAFPFDPNRYQPVARAVGKPVPPVIFDLQKEMRDPDDAGPDPPEPLEELEWPRPQLTREIPYTGPGHDDEAFEELEEEEEVPPTPDERRDHMTVNVALAACAALGAVVMLLGLYRGFFAFLGGVVLLGSAALLVYHHMTSPFARSLAGVAETRRRNREARAEQDRRLAAVRRLNERAFDEWERRNSVIRTGNRSLLDRWKGENAAIRERNRAARALWQQRVAERHDRSRQARARRERRYTDAVSAELDSRRRSLEQAEAEVGAIKSAWAAATSRYADNHRSHTTRIREAVERCRGLDQTYRDEFGRLASSAEAVARLRHLRLHQLADYKLDRIGAGRLRTLAAHGIVTAADVEESVVMRIKGFGAAYTQTLMAWRAEKLRTFRFNPSSVQSSPEHGVLARKLGAEQKTLLNVCDGHLRELNDLARACRDELAKLEPGMRAAFVRLQQAQADVSVIESLRQSDR